MANKIPLYIILLCCITNVVVGQTKEKDFPNAETTPKQLPSIAIGVGILSFNGDVGNGVEASSFGRIKTGYNFTIEQRIKKTLGVSLSATFGKIADSENGKINNLNFQSKITQVDLNLLLHLDNDIIFSRDNDFAPYIFAGIGFLQFDPYTDLKDKNGIAYNYWSDGTIRDLPESDPQAPTANLIQRDYKYETKLTDSLTNYSRNTIAIPIGAGITLKLSDNFGISIGGTYYITQSDWLDNIKVGSTDRYFFGNASLKYTFRNRMGDNSSPRYKTVDFATVDKIDSDGDGIQDDNDRCAATPNGVKTDLRGCPLDKDEDGVPDYKDKENETKKSSIVDENGVTISEQMLATRQSLWDSIATDRSQLFNENPSLRFLQDLDTKTIKNPSKKNNIPAPFKRADSNKDGYISSSEIIEAVDELFVGDSDYTFETINDLIAYFFEQ